MIKILSIFVFLLVGPGFLVPSAVAREVTDPVGRQLTVPDSPQRVVALAPSITEIVFALGQSHRLKGVTRYSDYPPEARDMNQVGSYVQLDLERIVALAPDLCIAIKDGNPKGVVQRLMKLNIPVYAVNPRSLDTVMHTISEIGTLLDADTRARSLVTALRERIARVSETVARAATQPRVFFQIGVSPIVSVGNHTFAHELILRAGGINLTQGDTPYPRYSREQVLGLAPDVIIITSMARAAVFEQVKADWLRWPQLPAAREQRIHIENSNLFDRPSPRLVDGLELLARLLHPDLFEGGP